MNLIRTIIALFLTASAAQAEEPKRPRAEAQLVRSQNHRIHTDYGCKGILIGHVKLSDLPGHATLSSIRLTVSPHSTASPDQVSVSIGSSMASATVSGDNPFEMLIELGDERQVGKEAEVSILASFPSTTKDGSKFDITVSGITIKAGIAETASEIIVTGSKSASPRFWKNSTANWEIISSSVVRVISEKDGKHSVVGKLSLRVSANGDIKAPTNSDFEVMVRNAGSETPCVSTVLIKDGGSIHSGDSELVEVSAFLPASRVIMYSDTQFRISKIRWSPANKPQVVEQTWGLEKFDTVSTKK